MNTNVWGPPLWHFLHILSFNYPVKPTTQQKKQYKDFLKELFLILPCDKCREAMSKTRYPDAVFKSRASLSRWIFRLHEEVNTRLGKVSGLRYEDVAELYENFRARCGLVDPRFPQRETGCTEPIVGIKSRCIISFVEAEGNSSRDGLSSSSITISPDCLCMRSGRSQTKKHPSSSSSGRTFRSSDLKSNDGMLTYVWGPALWHFLHTISFNYSPTDAVHYRNFFNNLHHVLPCKHCRDNLPGNMKDTAYGARVFHSQDSLSRWVFRLHERVNGMLEKTSKRTFEDVKDLYETFRIGCGMDSKCVLRIQPLK